jgi:transketolase
MSYLTEADRVQLALHANNIRQYVVQMLAVAKSGHTAGSLGMADIFAALYFAVLNHDPEDPHWKDRDRLILSNGHIAPVRYAAMALAGYFDVDELMTLRQLGSRLQGHPERTHLPGVETTSGPLGEGLGQAAGIALAARMDGTKTRTFCVLSDGEQQCGATWEAAMFAGANHLHTLTAIIDRNNIQISGTTDAVLRLEPLREKYEAFGWSVLEVDGHDVEMFCDATEQAHADTKQPTVIIAHTTPGKGVAEIEGKYEWHGKVPTSTQAAAWLDELEAARATIPNT